MRINYLVAATTFGAIALAACGSGSYSSGTTASKPAAPIATSLTGEAVTSGDTSLGKVLVDRGGLTLYGSTEDSAGTPTCVGACATDWPPLTVDAATLPAGLDANLFSVVTRPDGSHQLKAGKWPLYRFAGDARRGDVNGEGTAGFFVVMPNGSLKKS
jgi:predicted lipoprotein with Yx(FWY)xxD motif